MLLFIKGRQSCDCFCNQVSIHLMLLFIAEETAGVIKDVYAFQYISCCYLSNGFKAFLFFAFPIHPYFKAFSEILPAFFHFYIFLFIIAQPPCIYGLFSLFSIFSAGKISSNKYLYSVFAIHLIILNNQVFPIFTTCISNNFFSKYVVIHQFNNTHEILFVVYNLF